MTNERNRSAGRRSLLKKIVASGGIVSAGRMLPDNWKKPVIDSVILPAHAASSPK